MYGTIERHRLSLRVPHHSELLYISDFVPDDGKSLNIDRLSWYKCVSRSYICTYVQDLHSICHETAHIPSVLHAELHQRRGAEHHFVSHLFAAGSNGISVRVSIDTAFAQQACDPLPSVSALEPGPVQEAVVLRRGMLASEEQPIDVGTNVLMAFERHADRPVAV